MIDNKTILKNMLAAATALLDLADDTDISKSLNHFRAALLEEELDVMLGACPVCWEEESEECTCNLPTPIEPEGRGEVVFKKGWTCPHTGTGVACNCE